MWRRMYQPLMVLAVGFILAGGSYALARDEDVVTNIDHAWAKLFDHSDYTGERISIDYPKAVKDMREMHADRGERGVADMAASAHYQIPVGWALRLYSEPDFRGHTLDLVGTGRPERRTLGDLSNRVASFQWVKIGHERDYRD